MSELEPAPIRNQNFDQIWRGWFGKLSRYFGKPGTAESEKAIVLDTNGKIDTLDITSLDLNGTTVTSTAAELNYNDITTLGTVQASKTVTADANKDIIGLRYLSFGGQLAFPATQAASSDANTLDDYEEGTWTPSTDNLTGVTINTAKYTKIGRIVICDLRLTWTGSTSSGLLAIGLPFTSGSGSSSNSARTGVVFYSGTAILGGVTLSAHISSTSSDILFYKTSGGASHVPVDLTDVNGAYDWLVSFAYEV